MTNPIETTNGRAGARIAASDSAANISIVTGSVENGNRLHNGIYSPCFSHPLPLPNPTHCSSSSASSNTQTTTLRFIEEPLILTNQTTSASSNAPSCASELNRGDLFEIQSHLPFLEGDQKQYLRQVLKKRECYPQSFDREDDDYLERSCLLILSSYPKVQRYSLCNAGPKRAKCKRHHYCPLCNYLTCQHALRTYVPAYHKGQWHHLILSFEGSLQFTSSSATQVRSYWDACSTGLRETTAQKAIRGAYWVEELKIRSFMPTTVLPHVHAIVDAEEIGPNTVELLKQTIQGELDNVANQNCEATLEPNIQVKPIDSEKSLYDRIRYLYKTLDLVTPYKQAWEQVSLHGRSLAIQLNSQLRDCIDAHYSTTHGKSRMHSNGILSPNAEQFIGIKKKDRHQYIGYVAEVAAGRGNDHDTIEFAVPDGAALIK